ncbi:nucleotidyltransferase domain-containing protein [Ramlibacter sp. AW1]|uniref:Nucleotidyltransferase domain-containing protein n=1 Tax=Ramlibacter aurantiacus TaxID=2801330 RepID=A0A937D5H0_9BURK|nr:nucleotidyltransferase domain-containing protein [Ramlibacter aurantiacus]MBL0419903.1 nucleotidyltransferase domain-containing protein [Ramlibacter aurantiacus]
MLLHTELPLSAQTAYAQLTDVALSLELDRSIEHLHGSFSTKTVQGARYWYFAFRDLDGRVRQLYVGPDTEAVRGAVERARNAQVRPDESLAPLARSAVALGCAAALPKHLRAVRKLGDYGFFRAGGVLVGTHAFLAMGNLLGVRWRDGNSTTDVDFAHAGKNISVALPADVRIDVHEALTSFEQGFIPMVQLSGGAGASYKLSGDPEFQIDFLTSNHRGADAPVMLPNLNVGLQPLRFMEFSLEQVAQAVLIDRNGGAVVVSIPAPERYAVHKLLVAGERSGTLRTKANKDVQQAAALFEHLLSTRPDDLHSAWNDATGRGPGWRKRAVEGMAALRRAHPQLPLAEFTAATT